jgi:antirestriction protein ArdC
MAGLAYQGVNVLLLPAEAMIRDCSYACWLTCRQAAGMGGKTRKGEKEV